MKKHLIAALAVATAGILAAQAEISLPFGGVIALGGQGGPGPGFGGNPPPVLSDLPAVQIIATDPTALEGATTGAFTLVRTPPFTNDLAVTLKIAGTATNGVNYSAISNVVTIPSGQRATDILIQPLAPSANGNDQTVVLSIVGSDLYVARGGVSKVTIVQSTLHDLPPMVEITSPTNGAVITGTVVTLEATAVETNEVITEVAFYHGDTFIGSAKNPPYSVVWSNVPPSGYVLRAWAESGGQWNASDPVNITVSNTIPTIAITSPTNGLSELGPATVTIAATVTDPDNLVTKVEFFGNGDNHPLGTVSAAPYSLTISNLAVGNYTLLARAITSLGTHIDSATVSLSLTNDTPVVTLTTPTNGTSYVVGAPIELDATATDGLGGITKVGFYAGGQLLGEVTNAPYTFIWTNAFPGHYSLRAKAVNAGGVSAWSSSVGIAVTDPAPTVAITAPVTGATVNTGASVEIDADVTVNGAPIKEVSFYVNGRPVGKSTNAPYSTTWTAARAGTDQLTVIAVDVYGVMGQSKPVKLVVH